MLDLIAISPPDHFPDEAQVILRLLDGGLSRYHLRKPDWSIATLETFLQTVPSDYRSRLVLHQHHELIAPYELGGWHVKDHPDICSPQTPESLPEKKPILSRSLHRITNLHADTQGWDAVLLSPIFPSISKQGHHPSWTETELVQSLNEHQGAKLYALGGINAARAQRCQEWGFDGVVLHGALWLADDPLAVLQAIQEVL